MQLLIVDSHPIVHQGIRASLPDDYEVLDPVSDPTRVNQALKANPTPQLVVTELWFAGELGFDLLAQLRRKAPSAPVLIYSGLPETIWAKRALRLGARGYLSKAAPPEQLRAALETLQAGEVFLSEAVTRSIVSGLARTMGTDPGDVLSNRELKVFELIGRGYGTREIAEKLNRSVKTIETHRAGIRRKLQFESTGEILRTAIDWVNSVDPGSLRPPK